LIVCMLLLISIIYKKDEIYECVCHPVPGWLGLPY
jgi:hypothetical protein